MEVELGPDGVARTTDDKTKDPSPTTNEEGDVVKQKQAAASSAIRRLSVCIPPLSEEATKTQSKTELTHKELLSQESAKRQLERLEEQKREQEQSDDDAEVLGIPLPFRSVGERSSMTDLHNLLEQCPQPQPPLLNKQLKNLQLNPEQAEVVGVQVQRIKNGLERLQGMIRKFNCTERFKQDIDFIIAHVGPAIAKSERARHGENDPKKN